MGERHLLSQANGMGGGGEVLENGLCDCKAVKVKS